MVDKMSTLCVFDNMATAGEEGIWLAKTVKTESWQITTAPLAKGSSGRCDAEIQPACQSQDGSEDWTRVIEASRRAINQELNVEEVDFLLDDSSSVLHDLTTPRQTPYAYLTTLNTKHFDEMGLERTCMN
jgi:hypothetical protein